jgi:hypothetical protein
MTAVAGFTNGKSWAIAGDSGLFEDGETDIWWPTHTPKIWRSGDSLIGYAGNSRVGSVAQKSGLSDPHRLAAHLKDEGIPGDEDFDLLVVTRTAVWCIGQEFDPAQMTRRYHAIGAAAGPAFGVLHFGKSLGFQPRLLVRAAINAACDSHVFAIKPVRVLSLEA